MLRLKLTTLMMLGLLLAGVVKAQDTTQVATVEEQTYQQPKQVKEKKNINPYFGLTFGLGLGNYSRVSITPLVGFPLTPKFSVGARAGYEYVDYKREDLTYNNYGASAFARYRLVPQGYAHIEYAMYNYSWKGEYGSGNNWVPFLYVGGGYIQRVSSNMAIVVEVLFDVLQDEDSPYKAWQPVVSIGAQVGF